MKGYKVFNPDWTCRGFEFEVGKVYEHIGELKLCSSGFHFCEKANDCFNYYNFDSNNKVAEVAAIGDVLNDGDKSVTNKIKIVREVSWQELLSIINIGKENTGRMNTGNYNTGNLNTGHCNTGHYNTGDLNTGRMNTGDRNIGNYNTGNHNTGDRNTGNRNTGDYNTGIINIGNCNTGNHNTGDRNTGHYNTGHCNIGNCNAGYRNIGDFNTGYLNTGRTNKGDHNTGDYNRGDRNTGHRNIGDYNTGDFNKTNNSSGIFNTEIETIKIFDKESSWTYSDWLNSEARLLLFSFNDSPHVWVSYRKMTDEEKAANPSCAIAGGFLRKQDTSKIATKWWKNLSETDKGIIRALPNYDEKKFFCILGIKEEQK